MRTLSYLRGKLFPSAPARRVDSLRLPLAVTALEARRVLDAAPVINDQSFSAYEGAPEDSLIGYATASDVDAGDGLVFSIVSGNSDGLFKIDPLTGALRINNSPANGDVGSYALTLRVTDPTGKSDTATATIEVLNARAAQDDPPFVNDQTFVVNAGAAVGQDVGTVVSYEPDLLDDVTYSLAGTEFSINATTGLIEVADAAAVLAPGKYVRTVTVTDEGNNSDTAQITIIVNGPPTDIAIDNLAIDENSVGGAIGNVTVTDPNFSPPGTVEDQFVFEITGDAQNRFEIVGGQLKLKAGASLNYETEPSINLSIKVTDQAGATCTDAFVITVNDVAEAPTAISLDNLDVDEGVLGAVVGVVTVTDEDDTTFTYQILRETTPGNYVTETRFEINGAGELKLLNTESLDHETTASLKLRIIATDGDALSVQNDFTITVNDVNEAPTDISLNPTTVAENASGATVGALVITDPDNDAEPFGQHTITVLEDYGAGYVTSTRFEAFNGTIRLKSGVSLDYETETSVTLRIVADDGTVPAYSEDFVITVTDANDPPTDITLSNSTVNENAPGAAIGNVAVVDEDPTANPFGQHTLIVQEDYGSGFVTSTRFEIVGGQLQLKSGVSLNHETAAQVTVRIIADDGTLPRYSEDFVIDVVDVNEPPTNLSLGNTTVNENASGAVVGTVTVTDPDASNEPFGQPALTVQEDYGAGYVTSTRFEIVSGQLKLKTGISLNHEVESQVNLRILADDGTLPIYFEDFVITVIDRNDLPIASANEYSTDASTVVTGNVITDDTGSGIDADEDGDTLTLFRANGSFTAGQTFVTSFGASVRVQANGSFTYDPTDALLLQQLTALDNVTDSFTYQISDGNGGTSTAVTVTIQVSGVNDKPTVAPTGSDTGVEDTAKVYTHAQLLAEIGYSDPDNLPSTATILITDVQGGTLTLTGGGGSGGTTFRFDPTPDSSAPVTFKYQVLDADGETSDVGQFTLSIRAVNDAPTLVIGNQTVSEDGLLTISLAGLFTDVETPISGATFIEVSTSDNNAHVSFDPAAGTATFVLTPNFNGFVTFIVRATDAGDGADGLPDQDPLFAESTFVLTVTPVDDAPVAADDAFTFDEDSQLDRPAGVLIANDLDVDNDPALNQFGGPSGILANSFAIVSGPQHAGSFISSADGSFTYVPNPNFYGTDSFQYVVFDAQGIASNVATVLLNVSPVNDPPTFVVDPIFSINPVLPRPQSITSFSAGPFENDQTVSFTVASADSSILGAPSVSTDPNNPGQLLLTFAPAPFVNRVTTITITATDSEGLSTRQEVTVNLVVGQVPPANLSLEARQTLTFPLVRDTGVVVDLNQRVEFVSQAALDTGSGGGDAASRGERQVEVYLVDPATGEVIGDAQFTLPGKSLDRLNEIFRSLPDDRYRIVLKLEDGSRRRVMDVVVRDKQPFDPGDTQDDLLIPIEPPADTAPAGATQNLEALPMAAPVNSDAAEENALPLTPPGTKQQDATEIKRAAAPAWLAAPLLLAAASARRQRRQQAVQETLATIGRRPWLLHRLQRRR